MIRDLQQTTTARPFFPIDWAYLRGVVMATMIYSDDAKIRWLMAISSLVAGGQLLATPEIVDKPFFVVMRSIGPAWAWAVVFLLHGFGGVWRLVERRERLAWARAVNALGVAVWVGMVATQLVVNPRFALATSIEAVACFFLLLTLVSSGASSKTSTA